MATRFDASGDRLSITSGVYDSDNNFTWCGWVYAVSLPSVGNYATLFTINDNGISNDDVVYFKGTTGANKRLVVGFNNGTYSETIGTTAISTATWYFVALIRSSTTTLTAYLGTLTATIASEAVITTNASRDLPTRMEMGGNYSTNIDPFDGRIAYARFYDTNLTLAQLVQEQYVIRQQWGPAWGFWPIFPGSTERARDYSGNGRNWTEGGTLTDEAEPPISWGGLSNFVQIAAAAPAQDAHELRGPPFGLRGRQQMAQLLSQ